MLTCLFDSTIRWRVLAFAAILVICLVLIMMVLPTAPSLAAPRPQEEIPSFHRLYDGPAALSRLDSGETLPETHRIELSPEYVTWSRLAFQSTRNQHDWEIFRARGDGSNQLNLSNNTSMDAYPRLNRGATHVVFASNRHANSFEILTMTADGSGQTRLTNNSVDDLFPVWSPNGNKIAFQSYRDGQAEVYIMNANGSGQTRLSHSADYDGQPAWSPDGNRIAFVRRQGGQYRIWVMNADGSNARQLSSQTTSEQPVWSPDGQQIAYDADGDGDGWQEIWLMNANGGNQRQVYEPTEYNTDAWVRSWSPDGRYVAFTRISFVQSGSTWYWTTAYLDAWDSAQPGNILRLSGNGEDWFPDWQSLDVQLPMSQMQPLPAVSPGPFDIQWSGSDAGPSGLANYDVQVKDGVVGAWSNWMMATTATSSSYPGRGGHTYFFRVRARDNGGNVEAWPATYDTTTTVESMAPVSAIQPLPEFSRYGEAVMAWDGQDAGGSGIEQFDLQCRDGAAGAWQDCGTHQQPGSSGIPGDPGHTIFVRSRAIDRAGNVEPWPPGDGDTHTTLYTWMVSGTVADNGGTPVAGPTIVMSPTAFFTTANALDGRFEAYSSGFVDWVDITLGKPGYGTLPAARLTTNNGFLHGVLPPADNVVNNPGFEQALPGGWTVGGSAAATARSWTAHTGSLGAMLGWPFTVPENVSHRLGWSNLSDVAPDSAGGLHVIWWDHEYGNCYARRAPDGTWSEPVTVSTSANAGLGELAVDHNGTAYVVWSERVEPEPDIFLRRRTMYGQWSAIENVSRSPTNGSYQPQVGLDAQGVVHVIWTESLATNMLYYSQRESGGTWTSPVVISSPDPAGSVFGPRMVIHPQGDVDVLWTWGGNVHVGYTHRSLDGTWSPAQLIFNGERPHPLAGPDGVLHLLWVLRDQILYANRPPGGSWSQPEVVIVPRADYATPIGDAAADVFGTVHLGFYGDCASNGCEVKYMRREANSGTWSQPELIAATPSGSTGIQIAVDNTGTVYATWRHWWTSSDNYHELLFARRSMTGGWSVPIKLTDTPYVVSVPLITVDSEDRVHVLWTNELSWGGSDVFHARYLGTPPAGDSWLSQALAIPSGMNNPGLSFVYQYPQGNPDGRNVFSVVAQVGASTTPLFSTTSVTPGWTHQWVDLSPWRGETITVEFKLQNAADNSPALVYLDEVTVGSTYPDAWVQKLGPTTLLPSEQIVYTITYGNRGASPAMVARVTDSLPPGLQFVNADPPPGSIGSDLVWDVGDLPAHSGPFTITLTAEVNPPMGLGWVINTVDITSQSTELETHNNTTQLSTFVGYQRYFPLVTHQ